MLLLRLLGIALLLAGVCACSSNKSNRAPLRQAQDDTGTGQGQKGAAVFASACTSCHGANAQGTPGVFPPLAGNPVVTGDPKKVIHIVKYGLTGRISAKGKTYNGMMPAWSGQLRDEDIAAVLTYVRSSFGNHAGPITTAQVSSVSK
jgi:mono/diheme cytochrome c family protein